MLESSMCVCVFSLLSIKLYILQHCRLLNLADDNSTSGLRSNDKNHRITHIFNASLPPDFVPDSESATVSITG